MDDLGWQALAKLAFPDQSSEEAETLLEAAFEQLAEKKLVTPTEPATPAYAMSRRAFCLKTAVVLPAILTVAAPSPAQAQTGVCSEPGEMTISDPGSFARDVPEGCTMVSYTVRGAGGGGGGATTTNGDAGVGGRIEESVTPLAVDSTTMISGFIGFGGAGAVGGTSMGGGNGGNGGGGLNGGDGMGGNANSGAGGGGGGATTLDIGASMFTANGGSGGNGSMTSGQSGVGGVGGGGTGGTGNAGNGGSAGIADNGNGGTGGPGSVTLTFS